MSRKPGSVASSDSSWLKLYAAVAVLPLALAACGGGGGGDSPAPAPTPAPTPTPAPSPTPTPSPAPTSIGQTWNNVSVAAAGDLVGVDYDDNRFVAISSTGTAIGSTDAVTWTPVTPLTSGASTDHLTAYVIGHSGSNFVAAGALSSAPYTSSTGAVAISADGITWTMESLPAGATPIHGLISGTRLVGLGEAGHLYSSTNNGQSWTVLTTLASTGIGTMNAGAFASQTAGGTSKYVAVGASGFIAASSDGTVWGSAQLPGGKNLNGVAWTGTQFVAVGDGGTIITSPDGAAWTSRTSALGGNLRSVSVASNGNIVAVGDSGIETSTDGITWTARNDSGVAVLSGVAFGNNEFVAVGASSTVKTSTN